MTFTTLSLVEWGTLFAGVGGVVTLLYFLRLRRRRIEVPFGPLWQKILNDNQTTSLFRMLKRYLSLLLQLAMILLVVTALAEPEWTGAGLEEAAHTPEPEPFHTLLVVDVSASMGARDLPEGRMEQAREAALRVIETLRPDERVMLVSLGHDVSALTDWTMDRDRLRARIRELQVRATGTNLHAALDFARNAIRGLPNAQVVLVSDQAYAPADETLVNAIRLRSVPIHADVPSSNVAVLDFSIRSHLGAVLRYALYYKLKNFSDQAVRVTAYLYTDAAGTARTREDFVDTGVPAPPVVHELAPGEERVFERSDVEIDGARAAIVIETTGASDFRDALSADDVGFAVVPARRQVRVQLVGPADRFLEAALRARRSVQVTRVSVEEYVSGGDVDLTVFNGVAPQDPGAGNAIYVHVSDGVLPYEVDGTRPGGSLRVPSRHETHPLMRYVRFVDLEVSRLLHFKRRRGHEVFARGQGGAAAVIGQSTSERRWLSVGFNPVETEWVGHYSFSVFFVNAINWFFSEEARFVRSWNLAERWDVRIPWSGLPRVDVIRPDGERDSVLVDAGGTLSYTPTQLGFYEVHHPEPAETTQGIPLVVAAALGNSEESLLSARGAYPRWEEPELEVSVQPEFELLGASLWQLLVMMAMALMVLEWFTYHRRWTV